jgi:predicted RNA-binding Zn-ribbon protein involved in translation (DUF1610 family)
MLYQDGHSLEVASGKNVVVVKCPTCGREFIVMRAGRERQMCIQCSKVRRVSRVTCYVLVA